MASSAVHDGRSTLVCEKYTIYLDLSVLRLYKLTLARGTPKRASRSENPLIQHLEELDLDQILLRVLTCRILEMDI